MSCDNNCYLCDQPGSVTCPNCSHVTCQSHNMLHRDPDTGTCYPYTIGWQEGVGRQLIATRDMLQGELVYQEEPLVVGPNHESGPICLGCMSAIDLSYLCPSCGYPMCDQECAESDIHQLECEILARGIKPNFQEDPVTAYHVLLPLRLLLLSSVAPDMARLTTGLMDHQSEREGSQYWNISQMYVVNRLTNVTNWNEQEIHSAIGKLEVNAYEIHDYMIAGYRGLFPLASLISHSCIPNTRTVWSNEPPFASKCFTTRSIAKGEELTTSYLRPSMCSLVRRKIIKESWYFDCKCARCQDSTELGAHTNTLICPACKTGFLLPVCPLDFTTTWICSSCGQQESRDAVTTLVQSFIGQIKHLSETDRYDVDSWLTLYYKAKYLFHPQHEVLCELAKWCVPILARGHGKNLADFPEELLKVKIEMGSAYLQVLNIVEGEVSRNRAKTMYELEDTKLYLCSVKIREGQIDRKNAVNDLKEFIKKLDEILSIMGLLGAKTGYENMMVYNVNNIKNQCKLFLESSFLLSRQINES